MKPWKFLRRHDVPYYHHKFAPDYFTGWRGRLILLLNWLRWRLTRYMEKRVMVYVLLRQQLDENTIDAFVLRWKEENEEQGRRTSSVLGMFKEESKGHFYKAGRKNSDWPEDAVAEQAAVEQGLRPYVAPNTKAVYSGARDRALVQEVSAADGGEIRFIPRTELVQSQEE